MRSNRVDWSTLISVLPISCISHWYIYTYYIWYDMVYRWHVHTVCCSINAVACKLCAWTEIRNLCRVNRQNVHRCVNSTRNKLDLQSSVHSGATLEAPIIRHLPDGCRDMRRHVDLKLFASKQRNGYEIIRDEDSEPRPNTRNIKRCQKTLIWIIIFKSVYFRGFELRSIARHSVACSHLLLQGIRRANAHLEMRWLEKLYLYYTARRNVYQTSLRSMLGWEMMAGAGCYFGSWTRHGKFVF